MSLPSVSIRRPVTIFMFYAGIVLLGVIGFRSLPVDFLPSIKIPRLAVQTSYPNISPEEIENSVTQPIESALATVAGSKKVSSVSREGLSLVSVEFYWGTNMDFAMLDVREKLDQLRAILPREAGRPTILRVDPSTEPIMTIAVSETDGDKSLIKTSVENNIERERSPNNRGTDDISRLMRMKETGRALIKRRIEQIEGVAQASVSGGVEREIHVDVDSKKLVALGLSIDRVSQALANANLNLPGGTIKQGLFRYSLRTVGEFNSPRQIRDVVVMQTSGRLIRVSDIGQVFDTNQERSGITRYNGNEVIAVQVRKEAGANSIIVSEKVHQVLEQLRSEYPTIQLAVLADQAEFISKSINDVQQAIMIGALLAFLVLFLFLRTPRYPVIIGVVMPISIIATFVAMYFLHMSINVISLTGLALGIGMLGDNAIIVIENVTRLREKGMGLVDAAIEGSKEISIAVTASTLTNVAIFLPIVFVEGVAQQLFVDMGITMTISLLVSLLVAVTLVPMLVSRDLRILTFADSDGKYFGRQLARHGERLQQKTFFWLSFPFRILIVVLLIALRWIVSLSESFLQRIRSPFYSLVDRISASGYRTLERFLDWALDHRALVIFYTFLVFVVSGGIAFFIPSEPAPDIDQSRFNVSVQMAKGTTLEGVSAFVQRLETELAHVSGVKGVYSSLGLPEHQDLLTVSDAAIEKANLEIKVDEGASSSEVADKVRERLMNYQQITSGIEFSVRRRGTTFEHILRPQQNDIKIRVIGREQKSTHQIAQDVAQRIKNVKGLVDLRTSLQRGSPEYKIVIDRDQASRFGLTVQAVAQHLAQQVRGKEATFLSDFDRKITVRVQPSADQRKTIEDILGSHITNAEVSVPVKEMIKLEKTEGYSEIWRENQQRAVVMVANVAGRSVGSVVEDIKREIKTYALPPGYTISIGGENEEIEESFKSLFIIIILSLFLVYMILAAEYESILYPFVILLTSPLAFIGAIAAMALTGQHYNVMSLIGLVIMIGAVDNDAVIVVDIITSLRKQGFNLVDAIKEGMRLRFRPILMTTATTVLGIIPLFFEFGTGSELVRALTVPIVGGLIASTFFTIVAIPIVYTYVDRWAIGRENV